ncbi:MAG: sigma-70 family RNA polymerase sigma factor [Spirochaetaceae bacterium]|nr:sigma-70 family RNA polymerase sigma factor [Spirochaetaceae bacterium]
MKSIILLKIISISLAEQSFSDNMGKVLSPPEIETLLIEYNSYLLALLNYKLNDRELAEDILQETYLSFLSGISKKRDHFQNNKKLKNYLTTIALNKVKDYYRSSGFRSKKQYVFSTTEELDHFLSNTGSKMRTPDEELIKKERDESLNRSVAYVMEILSNRYRHILVLKYTENKNNDEISLLLGMSKKAVESLLFRAKKAFKKEMEKSILKTNEIVF